MAELFILIAIGYIAAKIKMLTPDGVKTLSKVVLNISTPSTILYSVLSDTSGISGSKTMYFTLLAVCAHALFFLVAIPTSRALSAGERRTQLRKPASPIDISAPSAPTAQQSTTDSEGAPTTRTSNRGLYASMIVFGNVGFMGYPVVNAIFGPESAFYAALFIVVFNLLIYSIGIIMISGNGGKVRLKVLFNATFIASVISFIIVFTNFRAPAVITETARLAGGINTPCAMLVIGATLAQISVKDVLAKLQLYPITILKMMVLPILSWLIFKQFVSDSLMLGLLVVLSGMPIAAAVAMISIEYGGDERIASGGVFMTTLLSAVTIPLIVYLLI